MRNRWEDRGDADLDAPATLTERELRGLRRRAGFAVLALLLALISIGGLGWTLFSGAEGLETIQTLKERVLPGTASTQDAERAEAQAPAAAPSQASGSATAQQSAADSTNSTTLAGSP